VDWIEDEPVRLGCPDFADLFVGWEAVEGLKPSAEVVRVDEVSEMRLQLPVAVVMVALYGGLPSARFEPAAGSPEFRVCLP
jgi:hypothetical protein